MKIEDLRIGNKVLFGVVECTINSIHSVIDSPNYEWHVRVSGIGNFKQYCLNGYEVEPIGLNTEIIKTFAKEIDGAYYLGNWNGINLRFKSQWCIGRNDSSGKYYEIKHGVKHLHEIQNLYYDLEKENLQFI